MKLFPWARGTTLTQAVIAGIPAPNTKPVKAKRPPTTEAALAARKKNCKRIAARLTRQLGDTKSDGYVKETIAHVLKHANVRGHSSRVFKSILGWELGTETAEKLGLPSHRERREALQRSLREWQAANGIASQDMVPAKSAAPPVDDWYSREAKRMAAYQPRIRREDLVHDAAFDRAQNELKALAIVNVGKKRRGEKLIDKSGMAYPGDRRKPSDD
jgi:hypothetical protein